MAAVLLMIGLSPAQHRANDIPRLAQVSPFLYRSGQPTEQGLKRLAEMGIRTIIDLRGSGPRARKEQALAHALGMRYLNVPLSNFTRPRDAQIERILEIIADPDYRPVLVHCRKGEDRTGVVIAVYRVLYDGWDAERAYREMRQFGFKWYLWSMKDYVFDFAKRLHESPSLRAPIRTAKVPGGD